MRTSRRVARKHPFLVILLLLPVLAAAQGEQTDQAELPSLPYRSPLEELAERFHVSPDFLGNKLNPGITLQPGAIIRAPNVLRDIPGGAERTPLTSHSFIVEVAKGSSALLLRDADGRVVFSAPATVGRTHDPLPVDDWRIRGVSWYPPFRYNPKLFWNADPEDSTATVAAGPNNPVGVAWIALNVEPHGIHGTPDPALVGHSYSRGCVRLTNWDAARVGRAVRPGTVVHFR